MLTAEHLADTPDLIELYDAIREIPQIIDGIRCYCGCAQLEGFRSPSFHRLTASRPWSRQMSQCFGISR